MFFLAVLLVSSLITATRIIPANENAKASSKASENFPLVIESVPGNLELERVNFIHYAKSKELRSINGLSCYKLLGVKWNILPVSYIVNPTNPEGLSDSFVTSTISASAETWDDSTSKELFNNAYGIDYSAAYGSLDNKNAISFGAYSNSNVIAVTSIWFNKKTKRIVEYDILFNTFFDWGDADINPSVMDLQNIATHELGHGVGLNDIYNSACSAVTMYGYSSEGETKGRTLEAPDITGLQKMYGI